MIKKLSKTLDLNERRTKLGKLLKFPQLTVALLFLTLIFQNCQAPTEGCLDLRATNFDVTASKACEKACCTYPSLVIAANYKVDTFGFYFDSTYVDATNQKFRIVSAQMYLSGFQLVDATAKVYQTIDSFSLRRATDTINALNDYALVGKNVGFNFTIGAFSSTGVAFTKLKFRLGLDEGATKAIPTKMPTAHPLSIKADSMYISSKNQYIFTKFVIAKGIDFKEIVRLDITTPKDIEIVKNLSFTEGSDAKIPLTINYLNFFKGVDFSKTQQEIQDKVVLNINSNPLTIFSIK